MWAVVKSLKSIGCYLTIAPPTHLAVCLHGFSISVFFFLRFFFLMWTIFKAFIDFVATLLLFYVLVFRPQGMWDLSSPTRDWTHAPCIKRWSLNHWTARFWTSPLSVLKAHFCFESLHIIPLKEIIIKGYLDYFIFFHRYKCLILLLPAPPTFPWKLGRWYFEIGLSTTAIMISIVL